MLSKSVPLLDKLRVVGADTECSGGTTEVCDRRDDRPTDRRVDSRVSQNRHGFPQTMYRIEADGGSHLEKSKRREFAKRQSEGEDEASTRLGYIRVRAG